MTALFPVQDAAAEAALAAIEASVAAGATAANQATANTALSTIAANTPTVGQKAAAASSPVVLASDQALPLPTGAATAANQATANTSLATIATAQGAGGTGIAEPAGGSGLLGWLSGIYQAVIGVLSVYTKNVQVTGNLTVADPTGVLAGSTVMINTDSLGSLGIKLGGNGVGTVLFQGTVDGTTWDNPKAYPLTVGAGGVQSATGAGDFEVNCAAFKQFRVCLSALTSGSFAVTFNGTAAVKHVGVKNGNAADLNATVVFSGSTGIDYSVNKPTIPNVGAPFGNAGPYANYVLIQTVPAAPTRNNVDIENTSGGQIVVVRDDGTAANGAAPANASVFPLGGGSAVGAQGGSWSSQTFKGRLQIYAPASTAQVTVMVD